MSAAPVGGGECRVEGCSSPRNRASTLCGSHRARRERYGSEYADLKQVHRPHGGAEGCVVDGCDKPHGKHLKMCSRHHYLKYKRASSNVGARPIRPKTKAPRLTYQVDPNTGCWNWSGPIASNGYGTYTVHKKSSQAHRVAYEMLVGPIGDGLEVDHLCFNKACVNPDHLEAVTPLENTRRANRIGHPHPVRETRYVCQRGHDWREHPPLLTVERSGRVKRECSVCRKQRRHDRRAAA